VDDSVVGTGTNQFNYVGTWNRCAPCTTATTPPLYNTSNSWTDGGDAGATESTSLGFVGVQIGLFGAVDPRNGNAAIAHWNRPLADAATRTCPRKAGLHGALAPEEN